MAQLVLNTVLRRNSRSVTTADNHNLALLRRLDSCVHRRLGAARELLHLKHTRWAVPQNRLGVVDGFLVQCDRLLAAVQTHPAVCDAVLVLGVACVGVGGEGVCGDVVDWEGDGDVLRLGLDTLIISILCLISVFFS